MDASDKYCLRWNDFESNMCAAFRDLRNDEDFYDVTLACNAENSAATSNVHKNGSQNPKYLSLRAHKVILSACSPYFKDLLKGFPREPLNPFIFIRGVRFEDLVSILDFIYYGEVSIAQNELTAFLNLAEELQVKGLTHKKSTKEAKRSINLLSNNESKESTQRLSDNKRQKLVASSKVFTNDGRTNDETYSKDKPTNTSHLGNSNSLMTEYDLTHSDRNNIKHKEKKTLNTRDIVDPSAAALSNESAVSEDFDEFSNPPSLTNPMESNIPVDCQLTDANLDRREYKAKIKQLIKHDSVTGLYYCLLCNQTSKQSTIISNHLEARHLQMMQYQCEYCGKEFSTRVHRNVHIHRIHKEEHKIAKVFGNSVASSSVGEVR